VDLALLERLLSCDGRTATASALAQLDAGASALTVSARLRASLDDGELVAAALTQATLRQRARVKLGEDGARMFWTRTGLEQATGAQVAAHRSERMAEVVGARVADLCCGLGGDLVALARAGLQPVGVEIDPTAAAIAVVNVRELGVGDRVDVRVADATAVDLSGFTAVYLDPARRTTGGRRHSHDPSAWSPPMSFVTELAASLPAVVAKVAPGIPHALVPAGAEAEWVSDGGQVKEAAIWAGALAGSRGPARRRATLLPEGRTVVDVPGLATPPVGPPGRFLHEPDGAVVRAGLVAEVAAGLDGRLLDASIAYITTDDDVSSPFTRRYAVEEVLPFNLKRLRAAVRARGAADVVVKKRGSAVDPRDLRRRLRLDGEGPVVTVVLTRRAGAPVAILATPVEPAPG
jgi:SAM-dependent methyltransferase